MNAKAFCYRFEGRKGIVERWVEMRITWKSAFCPRKPLNPKLIHVQKRPPRRLEGVHGPWFAQGVSWSSLLSTWGLYFNTFQQLAFRWGEWKIKFVSPVLGIDGKNPKSRAVPPGFRSTCGQEPASSMGQTAKITAALTLEDQSGLFQTLNCRFQEKMLIKQTWYFERGLLPQLCAVTFSPAPAKRFRNQKLAQRRWKHVWLSCILCLFPFYFFYTSQPVKASTEFLVLSVGCTHVVPCYLIK